MRRATLSGGPKPVPFALLLCLLLIMLTPLLTAARGASAPFAVIAYDCEGEACLSVTLTWEDETQGFRADNSSARRVRVEVESFAGKSSVLVEPGKSAYLLVKSFEGPYRASFE